MADNRNLRAALTYAKAGWPVFPCIGGEKVPATPNGVKDATSDPRQIRAWWARNPDRNVAIACGHPGPDVLDIDRKPDGASGFPALRVLRAVGLITNPRAMVRTPNDGAHLYFAPTPGAGNGSIRSAHIDHRGEGGYVVAPPSEVRRAADGQRRPYVVVHHQASTDRIDWARIREHLEPARERQWEPPAHLRDGGRQNLDHLVQHMAGLDDNRKRYLFWAACRVLDHNQPGRLADLAAAARQAGSDPRQIERTIRSAQATPRQDPHATPQPCGHARRATRRELEPQPAARQEPARTARRREEPWCPEVDRDGPEDPEQPAPSHEPEPARAPRAAVPGRTEHPSTAAPHVPEPAREEHGRPFAQADPGPEPEREAGE